MTIEEEADILRDAQNHVKLGDISTVREILFEAYKRQTDNQDIKMALADVLRMALQFDDAIALYGNILKQDARHIQASNNLARILVHLGQFRAAEDVWVKAITANGNSHKLLKRAASMFAHFDQKDIAEKFLIRANDAYPDGELTSFMLTALRGKDVPDRVPDAFVQQHFDNAAKSYESHLKAIGSVGPQKIASILDELKITTIPNLTVLDAGCGTGLCAESLKTLARQLHGVDLSSAMLDQARDLDIYDELYCKELTVFLNTTETNYELIIAADVLSYFGALEEVMGLFSDRLGPQGQLVISVEQVPSSMAISEGYMLSANGRYKHMKDYVLGVLDAAGFEQPQIMDRFVLRNEYGEPVHALGVAARKA